MDIIIILACLGVLFKLIDLLLDYLIKIFNDTSKINSKVARKPKRRSLNIDNTLRTKAPTPHITLPDDVFK